MLRERRTLRVIAALAAAGGISCASDPTGPTVPPDRVVPARVEVRLGETVQFTEVTSLRLTGWSVLEGSGHGIIDAAGLYHAPFVRPTGPTATVVAHCEELDVTASVSFDPRPPLPADCCGPAQARLPEPGEYIYVEELPVALVRVPPAYPDSAREAGVEGTVMLQALVCASGQIFEVRVLYSIPMLDAASVAAVEQWVFSPARNAGQPVAVWVAIPVKYSLHTPDGPASSLSLPE